MIYTPRGSTPSVTGMDGPRVSGHSVRLTVELVDLHSLTISGYEHHYTSIR